MSFGQGSTSGGFGGHAGPMSDDFGREEPKVANAEDLVIGENAAFEADADAVEKNAEERNYFFIDKPGQYHLVVLGFIGAPEKKLVDVFVNGGQRGAFETYSVKVKFGAVEDPRYQITDNFYLPPDNPNDLRYYNQGSTKPDGSTAGFHAEKCGHFLNRLIGGFGKGQPLPPAARSLKNWIGRHIDAEVVMQKERNDPNKKDPATGLPVKYPARAQIKLYSYRTATGAGHAGAQEQVVRQAQQGVSIQGTVRGEPLGQQTAMTRPSSGAARNI